MPTITLEVPDELADQLDQLKGARRCVCFNSTLRIGWLKEHVYWRLEGYYSLL